MAIYEYDCPQCGTFEVTQKMTDEALTIHPTCGSKVERKISVSSFALKGGGWYSDGYASTNKASAAPAPSCGVGAWNRQLPHELTTVYRLPEILRWFGRPRDRARQEIDGASASPRPRSARPGTTRGRHAWR